MKHLQARTDQPGAAGDESVALAHEAVATLSELAALLGRRRHQLAQSVGLTEQQWEVLEQIGREGFMPSLFARERDSSLAAVSKILRQLADKELVVAKVSKSDGRQRDYAPTAKGRRALRLLDEHRQDAVEQVWLSLLPEDLEAFNRIGGQLAAELRAYAEQADNRK